jgi:hypothetical protein
MRMGERGRGGLWSWAGLGLVRTREPARCFQHLILSRARLTLDLRVAMQPGRQPLICKEAVTGRKARGLGASRSDAEVSGRFVQRGQPALDPRAVDPEIAVADEAA